MGREIRRGPVVVIALCAAAAISSCGTSEDGPSTSRASACSDVRQKVSDTQQRMAVGYFSTAEWYAAALGEIRGYVEQNPDCFTPAEVDATNQWLAGAATKAPRY